MARTVLKGFAGVLAIFVVIAVIWLCILISPFAPRTVSAFTDEVPRDEVASLKVSNYPRLGPDSNRYTTDSSVIDRAYGLLEQMTFSKWDEYGIQRVIDQFRPQMVGGYRSGISLYDASGNEVAALSYDSGAFAGTLPGDGIVLYRDGCAYVMDGDQTELIDFLEDCVTDAHDEAVAEQEAPGTFAGIWSSAAQ